MCTRGLPDMYALSPRACGPRASDIHIRQIPRAHVTTITYMPQHAIYKNIKVITLLPAAVHVKALQSCSYLLTSTLSGGGDMYTTVNVAYKSSTVLTEKITYNSRTNDVIN